jgi:hypothetical protein
MRLVEFPTAGSGGRKVHINPEQVVCLIDSGEGRTQVVTTGLSGENSMSLVVDMALDDVAWKLTYVPA